MKICKVYKGHLKEKLIQNGSLKSIADRCTGKTIAAGLQVLSTAMLVPGKGISNNELSGNDLIALIDKLDLNFFEVSINTVTYQPYMTETEIHLELAGV